MSNFFTDCHTREPNDCDDDNQQDGPHDNPQTVLGARNTAMRDAVIQQIYARYETKCTYACGSQHSVTIFKLLIIRNNNFVGPTFLQL